MKIAEERVDSAMSYKAAKDEQRPKYGCMVDARVTVVRISNKANPTLRLSGSELFHGDWVWREPDRESPLGSDTEVGKSWVVKEYKTRDFGNSYMFVRSSKLWPTSQVRARYSSKAIHRSGMINIHCQHRGT